VNTRQGQFDRHLLTIRPRGSPEGDGPGPVMPAAHFMVRFESRTQALVLAPGVKTGAFDGPATSMDDQTKRFYGRPDLTGIHTTEPARRVIAVKVVDGVLCVLSPAA